MTDQEINQMFAKSDAAIAATAEQQKITAIQLAKTDVQLAKTDAQLAQTDAQLAKTDAQLAQTDAQLAKTDAQLAKTDAQLAQTDAQLAKTDAKLNKIAKMYGGVANNLGEVTEEFYFNSLKANPTLNGIKFDFIEKNITRNANGIEDEYDIVLVNGKDIFIIEVKYKAHQSDLDRLLQIKYPNFKKLYPEYKNYCHHLGLASFHINNDIKNQALSHQVSILQRKGDIIVATAA